MASVSPLFSDQSHIAGYVENGPARFAPGYDALLQISSLLMEESMGQRGTALVLGAGGGNELCHFAQSHPAWRFCAVDPASAMLDLARRRMEALGASHRVDWVEGEIRKALPGPFDAGCCLMTLHVIEGEEAKLAVLKAIRMRLKPGARFILANNCIGMAMHDSAARIERYLHYALKNGVPGEIVEKARMHVEQGGAQMLTPEEDAALLAAAGFGGVDLVYAGLSWRGWCATNPDW